MLGLIRLLHRVTRLSGHVGIAHGAMPTVAECRTHNITAIIGPAAGPSPKDAGR